MYASGFSLFFLLFVISAVQADTCNDNSNLAPKRLKKDLMCGYERSLRPVKDHKSPVRLLIRMVLKYISYDHNGVFTVDSWLAMFWKDEHLTWNPNDYESLKTIHLKSDEIWMPDLSVYNRDYQGGSPAAIDDLATCIVSNNGQVVCVPPTHQSTLCVADLTKFPFDTQNCTVRFGSWVHSGEEIDLKLSKPAITTEDFIPNPEWSLVTTNVVKNAGKYKCCPNNTYPSLSFSFKIKRLAGSHAASVILPAIALIVITLTSLWIPPSDSERISLCCVNVVCEFLYSQYVMYLLPTNGDNVPLIVLFGRDSLLLSAFTIVFSVALKNLVTKQNPAPAWISTIVSLVIGCPPGQFLFLDDTTARGIASAKHEDDGATLVGNSTTNVNSQDWIIFARILDRLCFISYCFVYLFMFVAFTP